MESQEGHPHFPRGHLPNPDMCSFLVESHGRREWGEELCLALQGAQGDPCACTETASHISEADSYGLMKKTHTPPAGAASTRSRGGQTPAWGPFVARGDPQFGPQGDPVSSGGGLESGRSRGCHTMGKGGSTWQTTFRRSAPVTLAWEEGKKGSSFERAMKPSSSPQPSQLCRGLSLPVSPVDCASSLPGCRCPPVCPEQATPFAQAR